MANIHKRKDKAGNEIYYARIPLGRDSSGKHTYKTIQAAKKKDLEKKLKDYEKDLSLYGKALDSSQVTFSQWFNQHLKTNCYHKVKPKTFAYYMSLYENHILPSDVGKMKLKDIKPLHLQEFLNERTHLATSTLKKIKVILHAAFDSAMVNNLIRINPINSVKLPLSQRQEKQTFIFTIEEQKRYIAAADNESFGTLLITLLLCGMRIGEALALTWDDLDFDNQILTINKSLIYERIYTSTLDSYTYRHLIQTPKSKNGIRTLSIPDPLLPRLQKQKESATCDLVFCTSVGTYIFKANVTRVHKRICKNAGLSAVNIHALRHTFASTSAEHHITSNTMQEILGHADIKTTLKIYTHATQNSKQEVKNLYDKLFSDI